MAKPRVGVNKICSACNIKYYVPNYRSEVSKFCSLICQNHKQYEGKRIKFTCFTCSKECTDSPCRINENRKYCSRECLEVQTKDRKEQARIAKAKYRLKYNNISSAALRKAVWIFKEKKCETCGYSEYDFCLDIHHIDKDPKNNNMDNLQVLCCICHKVLHKKKK